MDMQVAALDILTTKGGFAPAAARAIGEAMDLQIARSYDDLATNQRLDENCLALNSEIDSARVALNSKIDSVHVALNSKIDSVHVALNSKIDSVRVALNSKIDSVHVELKAGLDQTTLKLESAFALQKHEVRLQIEEAKTQFWRWMIWIMMGQTAGVAGLLRLFMPHGP